jgi:hypothetical protein
MEDIAEKVQALLSSITKCIVGDFPSLDAEGLSVRLGAGDDPIRYLGMTTLIHRPYAILVARAASYASAEAWLTSARGILDSYHSGSILSILLLTPPLYLGKDDQKMHEFQGVYKVMMKE